MSPLGVVIDSGLAHDQREVAELYRRLLLAWNARSASGMASLAAQHGTFIGFDGSVMTGPAEIEAALRPIFADHPTAAYVARIRSIRLTGPGSAILLGVAGMVPPGKHDIMPERNAIQTLVVSRGKTGWQIESFQNTPAAFHGRPELSRALTDELRETLGNGT